MPDGFTVGYVGVGQGSLFLIAGPCVIESQEHGLKMAHAIAAIAREKKIPYIKYNARGTPPRPDAPESPGGCWLCCIEKFTNKISDWHLWAIVK